MFKDLKSWSNHLRKLPVNYYGGGQNSKNQEPKPQKNVNLLVDGVQWQYANGVMRLHFSGHAELVENAFGHPGKYEDHWVHPVLLVTLQKPDHVHSERQKRPIKETVHHEHLAYLRPQMVLKYNDF